MLIYEAWVHMSSGPSSPEMSKFYSHTATELFGLVLTFTCVLHGEGRASPAAPKNQHNDQDSRRQLQEAVRGEPKPIATKRNQGEPLMRGIQMLMTSS